MENSYAKSLAKNKKKANLISSSSHPSSSLNSYKHSLIKLPLINKDSLGKLKSSSNYSTQASRRKKLQTLQKQTQQTRQKNRKDLSPRNFATDRDRSKSKNFHMKQQQQHLLMSNQSNQSQPIKPNKNILNRQGTRSIDDYNLEWSVNTVDTESFITKNRKLFEFQNIGVNIGSTANNLGQSSSMKTTDILDSFENHVKIYGTENIKFAPISKSRPKQLEIGKQLERVKLMQKETDKSIEKYVEYKKYQIEQVLNQKMESKMAGWRDRGKENPGNVHY